MKRKEQPTVWVGVSGGATLGVIAACRRPAVDRRGVAARTAHRNEGCRLTRRGTGGSRSTRSRTARLDSRRVERGRLRRRAGRGRELGSARRRRPNRGDRAGAAGRSRSSVLRQLRGTDRADDEVPVLITVGERSPAPRHEAAERAAELLQGRRRRDPWHRPPSPDRGPRRPSPN